MNDKPEQEKDFSLMEERDRRNNAGTLGTAPTKVLVVEDRQAELHKLAGGLAAAKAGANTEQLVEIEKMERQIKRAMGIRRLKPQLVPDQVVTILTEFGEREERILKIKADGSVRVTRKDLIEETGEIVQIQARVGEQDVLTDYMITSFGKKSTALRLMSPAEIEARKAAAQPHVVIERLTNAMAAAGQAHLDYTVVMTRVNDRLEAMGKVPELSASQLARRARKLNRQRGTAARAAERRGEPAGAFGLPEHAEAA